MAPLLAQSTPLALYRAMKTSNNRVSGIVAPRRAIQRVQSHVMRAAKLDDIESSEIKEKKLRKEENEDDDVFEGDEGLNPQQVEAFLNVLCEETDIAEVQLKMGGFKMKVRRSIRASTSAPAAAAVAVAAPATPPPAPAAAPVATSSSSELETEVEDEESFTMPIAAPKVGVMRRGRYIKGKKVGKAPAVEVGDTVKKGQALGFIEQLGTFWPIEAPQAGEIEGFVVEEGEPVEYGQTVVELVPFFGGHIIGDSKHA